MSGWDHKGSFVLRFKQETNADAGRLYGRIDHVASNRSVRFDSLEELLDFVYGVLREVRVEFQQ
ncbi:MAG TPA: hypothetical protein VF074_09100, partial [Pyrinomonadaceae bacterium]